jgi:hypothetical protein
MRRSLSRVAIFMLGVLLLIPTAGNAQSGQTTGVNPPIAPPLVREGDFAVDLAAALKLGAVMNETEAESKLTAVDIMPRNGWIADYPVTPDILGELQDSMSAAADSGKLSLGKDAALSALQDVIKANNTYVVADVGQTPAGEPGTNYPVPNDLNAYYDTEGPPAVTYYSPPSDYAYLYTWVPYPFWWSDVWFPGFFVLGDFDIRVHDHRHRQGGFISNHFHDPRTGRIERIDPTNRYRGGTFTETAGMRRASPSAHTGAQTILNNAGAYKQSRGYGVVARPTAPNRSSVFDRTENNQFERAASQRGFQSRSKAGQIPSTRGSSGGGSNRGGSGGGYHGGGGRGRSR